MTVHEPSTEANGAGRKQRFVQRLLMTSVRGYRLFFRAWLGNSCRFDPSCSAYALQALDRHGAAAGSYLTLRRIARCQPLCAGGCDPVPAERPALFSLSVAGRRKPPVA